MGTVDVGQLKGTNVSMQNTQHVEVRASQRGYSGKDFQAVINYGTRTRSGYLLTRQDAARLISEFKQDIADLERLAGTHIVTANGKIITIYHTSKKRQSMLLRG